MKFLIVLLFPVLAHGKMTDQQAKQFVDLALAGLTKEFPNKPGHVYRSAEAMKSPQEYTPVFYGHFDWHSSVHGHWTLVRLLRLFPNAEWVPKVKTALDGKFDAAKLKQEAAFLKKNKTFERMYGWAWALRLGIELRALEDQKWAKVYAPLEQVIVDHSKAYLPKLSWPIRCGFHPETAFPLGQLLDWARATGDTEFEKLIITKAKEFYEKDRDYPVQYEPSGEDFFSASLNEADLMRRVLPKEEFQQWITGFFPSLGKGKLGNLLTPQKVTDLTDGYLTHLAGLNLTRAWTMRGIAESLQDERGELLLKSAQAHEALGLTQIFTGDYAGEHWLGSFATYLLTEVGLQGGK